MKGLIYKIYYRDIIYIGSTFQTLEERFGKNNTSLKPYLVKHGYNRTSLYEYFTKYGFDNFTIELIKEYDVVDKHHLLAYEQLYINNHKCINKCQTVNWFLRSRCEHGRHEYYCIDCLPYLPECYREN